MNKPLTRLLKIASVGTDGSSLRDPTTYRPALPRVWFGIAGIALTVVTFALSVVLPAQTVPGTRESRVLEASETAPSVPKDLVTLASVTVVAARDPGSRAIVRVSSAVQ
jgi:hypothetical protein